MTGKRRRRGADFKAKVALGPLRGELTTAQLPSIIRFTPVEHSQIRGLGPTAWFGWY